MDAYEVDRIAAQKVADLLALPMPDNVNYCLGEEGTFDPWELFPCLYGSYSSDFDQLAVTVLTNLQNRTFEDGDLASEMFREMLCTANLCDYGSSPRVCFPTQDFLPLLPALIEKWKEYATLQWGRDIFEEGECDEGTL